MTPRVDARSAAGRRLPPGQIETRKWPVLHTGSVPRVDPATWRFRIWGAVRHPVELDWPAFTALPRQETLCDIHCVTRWSRFDTLFAGVPVRGLLAGATPFPRRPTCWRTPRPTTPPTSRWRTSTARRTCWPPTRPARR